MTLVATSGSRIHQGRLQVAVQHDPVVVRAANVAFFLLRVGPRTDLLPELIWPSVSKRQSCPDRVNSTSSLSIRMLPTGAGQAGSEHAERTVRERLLPP